MKASEGDIAAKLTTRSLRIGDLVDISRLPAVISLSDLDDLRARLQRGEHPSQLSGLLGEYYLGGAEVRTAVDLLLRSLGRKEARGDAFSLAGVPGAGKSHLLSVLSLLSRAPQAGSGLNSSKHTVRTPPAPTASPGPSLW